MNTLRIGDRFPKLHVHILPEGELEVPTALSGSVSVLVFYRGHW
jgi:hypothetical protein